MKKLFKKEDEEDILETSDEFDTEISDDTEEEIDNASDEVENDEEYEEEDEETLRRINRHNRRIRNQIISYTVIVILLAGIITGAVIGIRSLAKVISSRVQANVTEEVAEEVTEDVTIEAPESVETELSDEEEVVEEVDYLGEAVQAAISTMTLEDKVAQLFVTTPEALTGVTAATQALDGTRDALNTYAVGGLVYSSKNVENAEQLTELISTTAGMSKYELFLMVSEPGGESSSISNSSLDSIPSVDSPATIGETGTSSNAYNAGNTIASYLKGFGFNVNMAPDGSIITVDDSIVADISYGKDEAVTYDMAVQMIQGLEDGGVHACMTGFPGMGDVTTSTESSTVESEILPDVLAGQILPYISGVAAGTKLIQLNNVTYINADSNGVPASISPYMIQTLLRGNMGYTGIVITGSLADRAITDITTTPEAVISAIEAGADMVYVPDGFKEAYDALLEAVKSGTISEDRVNESLDRIYRLKLADDIE